MSHVYLVIHKVANEGDNVLGVFTDYVKARQFDLQYLSEIAMLDGFEWTEIRKIEVDKSYSYEDIQFGTGEVV